MSESFIRPAFISAALLFLPLHVSFADPSPEKEYALRVAAGTGDIATLQSLLSGEVDVNGKSNSNDTALHAAVRGKQAEAITILIEAGADVNAKDADGDSPLILAVNNGDVVISTLLLSHKADVNTRAGQEVTPLIKASGLGNTALVKLLLENNANIDAVNNNGFTSLMTAVKYGSKEVTDMLMAAGADVTVRSLITGDNALTLALASGNTPLADKLSIRMNEAENTARTSAPTPQPETDKPVQTADAAYIKTASIIGKDRQNAAGESDPLISNYTPRQIIIPVVLILLIGLLLS